MSVRVPGETSAGNSRDPARRNGELATGRRSAWCAEDLL